MMWSCVPTVLIEQAKEGVTYREFDAIPREIINTAGTDNFTHGIGHGIGLIS